MPAQKCLALGVRGDILYELNFSCKEAVLHVDDGHSPRSRLRSTSLASEGLPLR